MWTTLRAIASAPAFVPLRPKPQRPFGTASLRRTMPCRKCGRTLRFSHFVRLNPVGIRGYYSDFAGHVVSIDRDYVTRLVGSDADRHYFA